MDKGRLSFVAGRVTADDLSDAVYASRAGSYMDADRRGVGGLEDMVTQHTGDRSDPDLALIDGF